MSKTKPLGFCPSCFAELEIFNCLEKYVNRSCTLCSWRGNHKEALKEKPEKYRITDEKLEQMHKEFSKLVQPEKIIVNLVEDLRDARKELKKKNT